MPSALAITRSSGRGDETAHQVGIGADVDRRHLNHRDIAAGYWRTLNERIACSPAIRMTRFTTTAKTGRLTNRSVNFMVPPV